MKSVKSVVINRTTDFIKQQNLHMKKKPFLFSKHAYLYMLANLILCGCGQFLKRINKAEGICSGGGNV